LGKEEKGQPSKKEHTKNYKKIERYEN